MSEPASYYVTADWKRFVPEGDPQAAYGVAPVDIDRLGLRQALDAFLAADAGAGNGEAPASPAPADKRTPRPADKRRRFPDPAPRRTAPEGDD